MSERVRRAIILIALSPLVLVFVFSLTVIVNALLRGADLDWKIGIPLLVAAGLGTMSAFFALLPSSREELERSVPQGAIEFSVERMPVRRTRPVQRREELMLIGVAAVGLTGLLAVLFLKRKKRQP